MKVAALKIKGKVEETRKNVISAAMMGMLRLSILESLKILDTRISRSLRAVKKLVQ
jgi:hypothetical protein